jgi:hypothetical protein
MSHITLPRAVVEQVREALESLCQYDRHGEPLANIDVAGIKAADALDAALAEPDAIARAVEAEREAICPIVYGLCISDNNAQEIVNAIRARGSK